MENGRRSASGRTHRTEDPHPGPLRCPRCIIASRKVTSCSAYFAALQKSPAAIPDNRPTSASVSVLNHVPEQENPGRGLHKTDSTDHRGIGIPPALF